MTPCEQKETVTVIIAADSKMVSAIMLGETLMAMNNALAAVAAALGEKVVVTVQEIVISRGTARLTLTVTGKAS